MRKFLLSMLILPIVAGCGTVTATYEIHVKEEVTTERESMLLSAALRVIERRMANIGETISDLNLNRKDGKTLITVQAKNAAPLETLTLKLTMPFQLRIMEEAPEGEKADIIVEGHGGFRETGLTQEHLEWLTASEESGNKGRVTLGFTQEGRNLMGKVFKKNLHGYIGLFVRDLLVSKLLVETDQVKDDIIITDIPSVELANVFADDVNVGLYVEFVPIP